MENKIFFSLDFKDDRVIQYFDNLDFILKIKFGRKLLIF